MGLRVVHDTPDQMRVVYQGWTGWIYGTGAAIIGLSLLLIANAGTLMECQRATGQCTVTSGSTLLRSAEVCPIDNISAVQVDALGVELVCGLDEPVRLERPGKHDPYLETTALRIRNWLGGTGPALTVTTGRTWIPALIGFVFLALSPLIILMLSPRVESVFDGRTRLISITLKRPMMSADIDPPIAFDAIVGVAVTESSGRGGRMYGLELVRQGEPISIMGGLWTGGRENKVETAAAIEAFLASHT